MTTTSPSRQKSRRPEIAAALHSLRRHFGTVVAFSLCTNLLMLVPAIYMLQIYDRVLASRNETTLGMLTLLLIGLLMLMAAVEVFRGLVLVRIGAHLDMQLNHRTYTAAYEQSLATPGGNPAQALQDLSHIRQSLSGNAVIALCDAPWIPIYLAVIYLFHPGLGLFALGGTLVMMVIAWLSETVSRPPMDAAQKLAIQSAATANNTMRNAEVIEALGMLPAIRQRWFQVHQRFLLLQASAADRSALLQGLTRFVRIAMQSLVLGYGALLAIEHAITPGMMIAASILAGRALAPVEQLVGNWKGLVSARAAYHRLQDLLTAHPERPVGMPLPPPVGHISVRGLAIAPPGKEAPVVKHADFSVAPGEVLAIIGPSAAGKSSLARALVGVWSPLRGTVRLDGAEIQRWDKADLGPCLGYLPQDIELFDGTVAENIARFGEVDSEQVVVAAQAAGMHELILRLANGYDTPVGLGGAALSGGTRQRIGLARALYGDPPLVVLDEPTSSLDESGLVSFVATLQELKARQRAVIIITHQNAPLAVADKVLLMVDGEQKAFGPRDAVMQAIAGRIERQTERQAPRRQAEHPTPNSEHPA